jgi:hypothetical protein
MLHDAGSSTPPTDLHHNTHYPAPLPYRYTAYDTRGASSANYTVRLYIERLAQYFLSFLVTRDLSYAVFIGDPQEKLDIAAEVGQQLLNTSAAGTAVALATQVLPYLTPSVSLLNARAASVQTTVVPADQTNVLYNLIFGLWPLNVTLNITVADTTPPALPPALSNAIRSATDLLLAGNSRRLLEHVSGTTDGRGRALQAVASSSGAFVGCGSYSPTSALLNPAPNDVPVLGKTAAGEHSLACPGVPLGNIKV